MWLYGTPEYTGFKSLCSEDTIDEELTKQPCDFPNVGCGVNPRFH